jgi:hypothetical protein
MQDTQRHYPVRYGKCRTEEPSMKLFVWAFWILLFNALALALTPIILHGAEERPAFSGADPGAPISAWYQGTIGLDGQERSFYSITRRDTGIILPDSHGDAVWSRGQPRPDVDPAHLDARELKLHVRELADQLLTTMPTAGLAGYVALPASFVNQDDFDQSSSFGRLLAEQLFYEFNQRGFPVREYRYPGSVVLRSEGEFVLSRSMGALSGRGDGIVFVTGTYFREKDAIFVNARMIRGSDGLVLRAAQLIVRNTPLIDQLFVVRRPVPPPGRRLPSGTLSVVDYDTFRDPPKPPPPPPPPSTPFDRGLDVH